MGNPGPLVRLLRPVVRRFHHRLRGRLLAAALPYLPFSWQVRRLRPGKRDISSVTAALKIWCEFIERTRDVPGCIAELGVRAADSLIPAVMWAHRKGIRKHFYGFDSFQGHPPASAHDAADRWASAAWAIGEVIAAREAVALPRGTIPDTFFRAYSFPKCEWVQRRLEQYGIANDVTLVEGWFKDTMPTFKEPLSMIKNDSDLYESTLTGLTHLWPRLPPGGGVPERGPRTPSGLQASTRRVFC